MQKSEFDAILLKNLYYILRVNQLDFIMDKDINRIKVILAEKKRTNKWLAEKLDKDPATVSKWCTNSCQPPIETFLKIADLLDVELSDLIRNH